MNDNTTARADGRTHFEATLDVHYGLRFNDLCCRFYRRCDTALSWLTLVASSAAAVSVFNAAPAVAIPAALVIAAATALQVVWAPGRLATEHRLAQHDYARLSARLHAMPVEAIDEQLRLLQGQAPSGLQLLAVPAYNANLRTAGCEDGVRPLSWPQRIAAALA